jgi:hypothetical protein
VPAVIEEAEYPAADRVLRVFQPGVIDLQGKRVRLHRMLSGERVGVVSVGDNEWSVEWRGITLGIVNTEATQPQIRPVKTASTSR